MDKLVMETHHWYTLISYTVLCYLVNGFAVWKVMTKYDAQDWYSDQYWMRVCNFIWIFAYSPFSMPVIVVSFIVNSIKRKKMKRK